MPKGHSLKRNLNMFILFTVYPIIDIMILIQEHIMHTSLCLEINIYPATQTYQIGILLKLSYPFISFFSSSYLTFVQPGEKKLTYNVKVKNRWLKIRIGQDYLNDLDDIYLDYRL